jgi:hypothetical protein
VDIKAYMSSILQLPAGHDVGLFDEAQRFMRRRRRFLHRRGDLSAFEIEGLISREWRRRARQRLNREYDPIDTGTYLDGLLSEYNSDTEEPDEVDLAEASSFYCTSGRCFFERDSGSNFNVKYAYPSSSWGRDCYWHVSRHQLSDLQRQALQSNYSSDVAL